MLKVVQKCRIGKIVTVYDIIIVIRTLRNVIYYYMVKYRDLNGCMNERFSYPISEAL